MTNIENCLLLMLLCSYFFSTPPCTHLLSLHQSCHEERNQPAMLEVEENNLSLKACLLDTIRHTHRQRSYLSFLNNFMHAVVFLLMETTHVLLSVSCTLCRWYGPCQVLDTILWIWLSSQLLRNFKFNNVTESSGAKINLECLVSEGMMGNVAWIQDLELKQVPFSL